ncbi:hypothetical protein GF391_01510 [Candidatus Uhrbacteria bacterium]|nr:hypothetical protein [Candidatus Uhrbacteria bacterium]
MKNQDAVEQVISLVEGNIESSYSYDSNRKTWLLPKSFSLPNQFANGLSYNQFISILILLTDLLYPCMSIKNRSIKVDRNQALARYSDIQQQVIEAKVLANLPGFLSSFKNPSTLRQILVGSLLAKQNTTDFDDTKFVLSLIF